jgi:hypothetical protein
MAGMSVPLGYWIHTDTGGDQMAESVHHRGEA